jgi:hypothetical protein
MYPLVGLVPPSSSCESRSLKAKERPICSWGHSPNKLLLERINANEDAEVMLADRTLSRSERWRIEGLTGRRKKKLNTGRLLFENDGTRQRTLITE